MFEQLVNGVGWEDAEYSQKAIGMVPHTTRNPLCCTQYLCRASCDTPYVMPSLADFFLNSSSGE